MATDLHARRLLVFLLIVAVALTALLIRPFWVALFLAAVLAGMLRGWMEWLARRLGGRRSLAATFLTLGVLLILVLPLAGFGAVIVQKILVGVEWLRQALASEGIVGLVHRLPAGLQALADRALAAIPDPQHQLQQLAGAQGGEAAAVVGGFLAATGGVVFQAALMLIAFFFFLTDGERLIRWLDERVPLRPGQLRAFLLEFRRTSASVLVATAATAGIQTATALVGFLIARAPNPLFLSVLTFIGALIPAVGGTATVVVVGLILVATGHLLAGLFLVAWGIAVVAIIDNVARPLLLKGGMELHGGVVFFALLGGLSVFGAVGLVVGPLVVTFLITAVTMYRREFGGPGEAAGPDARAGVSTAPEAPTAATPVHREAEGNPRPTPGAARTPRG